MEKTVNSSSLRKRLSDILDKVQFNQDKVIVERKGKPAAVLVPLDVYEGWKRNRDRLFALIAETQAKSGQQDPDEVMALLAEEAILVNPQERLHVSTDEADNRYLECAVAIGAQYIVTVDHKHLIPLGEYRGIKIIPPSMFLVLINYSAE